MTHVFDDPETFREQVLTGFLGAYSRYVERVAGASGFIRLGGPRSGKVSLVVGGGSGHYPSYSGVTGPGFADGCVLGDVFASPSAEQIVRVGLAAEGGAGLILGYGNYAGDRLNFGAAADQLRAEGIDTRMVYVTDDVASAPPAEADRRRGIAGTFTVYKIAGAAAEAGYDLDGVETAMRAANAATFSFGVAFAGCTLPGKDEPLFTVPAGQMEFGLGIHGEPGIRSAPRMPAATIAEFLVASLLSERPPHADGRAAVIVNGLGSTKYEELLVLYGHVERLLADAGVRPVLPEVGEVVTSLDMAGCSLSLTWLDDELERLWTAPADTAAFRRGQFTTADDRPRHIAADRSAGTGRSVAASPASLRAAGAVRAALAALTRVVLDNEERLGEIDAVAGDGDHGMGMARGAKAALDAAERTGAAAGAGTVLNVAGRAFADKAGGTSGMLWGLVLETVGQTIGDHDEVTGEALLAGAEAAAAAITRVGGAGPGDKTMLDALLPFVGELGTRLGSGDPLAEAWRSAAAAAVEAAQATAAMRARVGRARPLAERSVGTPDPGAVSMGLILTAVGDVLAAPDTA